MKRNLNKITEIADELAIKYNKTKDPLIREEWYRVVRSLGNSQPSHNETSDIILRPPQR